MQMWYGGDYNPEQWDNAILDEDMELMKRLRVNTATLGVFAWSKLEPRRDEYDFGWMDDAIERLHQNGIRVILATPTSGPPFWLAEKAPEVMRVTIEGTRMKPGARANFCPSSPEYISRSLAIVKQLAKRYGRHPAVTLWHINNEYEHYCYCPACAERFREWLKGRYGTVQSLNAHWSADFWSHTYTDFSQVHPPDYRNEIKREMLGGRDIACFQAMVLDYRRFMSATIAERISAEAKVIRRYSEYPVTNNFTGLFQPFDYNVLARAVDVISWDNYPTLKTPPHRTAFTHDLMRGLKNGADYMTMEQTPNNILWRDYCPVKRPQEVSRLCWQGVAHGSKGNLFFQWRQSLGGVEKFHGAMVPHSGRLDTRIGAELKALGAHFERVDELDGARTPARVAVLFSWNSWWALECSAICNNTLRYDEQVLRYYEAFYRLGVTMDVISPDAPFDGYRIIVAPCCYLCGETLAKRLTAFVQAGGTLLTNFLTGIAEETDRVVPGGYPGHLRELLGLWVEETDGLYPDMKNDVRFPDGTAYSCGEVCDILRCEGAQPLAHYGQDFYAGTPAITEHRHGIGHAYYVATQPEEALLERMAAMLCGQAGVEHRTDLPPGVEHVQREKNGRRYRFFLNHTALSHTLALSAPGYNLITGEAYRASLSLPPYESLIFVEEENLCEEN